MSNNLHEAVGSLCALKQRREWHCLTGVGGCVAAPLVKQKRGDVLLDRSSTVSSFALKVFVTKLAGYSTQTSLAVLCCHRGTHVRLCRH